MHRLALDRKQLKVFIIIAAVISVPFYLLAMFDAICGEDGLVFLPHAMFGLPWGILLLFFPIPGFSTPPVGDGPFCVDFTETFLMYLPIYINLYILIKIIGRKNASQTTSIQGQNTSP